MHTVELGEEIVVTRHGKPIGRLAPLATMQERRARWERFLEEARKIRVALPPGEKAKDYIEAGRKR